MKHFLVAFFILFSSLSNSWAGVVAAENLDNKAPCPHMASLKMASAHDCCDSEMSSEMDCPNCQDKCHCNQHTMHAPGSAVVWNNLAYSFQAPSVLGFTLFVSQLPVAPTLKSFQPPKIA